MYRGVEPLSALLSVKMCSIVNNDSVNMPIFEIKTKTAQYLKQASSQSEALSFSGEISTDEFGNNK